eukprot:874013-Prymnesium_polylepis.1
MAPNGTCRRGRAEQNSLGRARQARCKGLCKHHAGVGNTRGSRENDRDAGRWAPLGTFRRPAGRRHEFRVGLGVGRAPRRRWAGDGWVGKDFPEPAARVRLGCPIR